MHLSPTSKLGYLSFKSALSIWAVIRAPMIACYIPSRTVHNRVNGNPALHTQIHIVLF